MGRASKQIDAKHSVYHEELLELREIVAEIGKTFPGEMILLCRAYRRKHARIAGIDDPITEQYEPEPEDKETPAAQLLRLAMDDGQTRQEKPMENHTQSPSKQTPLVEDREKFEIHNSPPPAPPTGIRTRKGPSPEDLLSITGSQWIKIKPDEMKFSSLKQRVAVANTKSKKENPDGYCRLICWQQQDGHMIVRREA